MYLQLITPTINHVLRSNTWALQRLLPFAGRVVRIDHPPFSSSLVVTASGEVAAADPGAEANVTVRLTPALTLRLMARDASAWQDIKVEGDAEFAAAINHVARNVRWDVEEDLSRVFGDIAAHRMVEAGRKLDQWARQGADNLARSVSEYWTEEQPLIASRADVEQFNREVDTLRDDVARLEKRVERRRE